MVTRAGQPSWPCLSDKFKMAAHVLRLMLLHWTSSYAETICYRAEYDSAWLSSERADTPYRQWEDKIMVHYLLRSSWNVIYPQMIHG